MIWVGSFSCCCCCFALTIFVFFIFATWWSPTDVILTFNFHLDWNCFSLLVFYALTSKKTPTHEKKLDMKMEKKRNKKRETHTKAFCSLLFITPMQLIARFTLGGLGHHVNILYRIISGFFCIRFGYCEMVRFLLLLLLLLLVYYELQTYVYSTDKIFFCCAVKAEG